MHTLSVAISFILLVSESTSHRGKYNIDLQWLFEMKGFGEISSGEKNHCRDVCMAADCKMNPRQIAHECMQGRCPYVSCGCDFNHMKNITQAPTNFRRCLIGGTDWGRGFQKRRRMYRNHCGISVDSFIEAPPKPFKRQFKLTEGEDAELLRFPWSVRVQTKSDRRQLLGSATMIGPTTLLTARHVLDNIKTDYGDSIIEKVDYAGGDVYWDKNEENGWLAETKSYTFHPSLDLAVVELDKPIPNTAPICMPPRDQKIPPEDPYPPHRDRPYRTAGWGMDLHAFVWGTNIPDRLQWADLKWYTKTDETRCNQPGYICSDGGYNEEPPRANVCEGDSGTGWLYRKYNSELDVVQWHLMGIAHRGSPCGNGTFGVWFNITNGLPWICDVTGIGC